MSPRTLYFTVRERYLAGFMPRIYQLQDSSIVNVSDSESNMMGQLINTSLCLRLNGAKSCSLFSTDSYSMAYINLKTGYEKLGKFRSN